MDIPTTVPFDIPTSIYKIQNISKPPAIKEEKYEEEEYHAEEDDKERKSYTSILILSAVCSSILIAFFIKRKIEERELRRFIEKSVYITLKIRTLNFLI